MKRNLRMVEAKAVHKFLFVCCTPTYLPTFTPLPKTFLLALLENNMFLAPFSSENHDFAIMQQWKKKKCFSYYLPTKKYRVGV